MSSRVAGGKEFFFIDEGIYLPYFICSAFLYIFKANILQIIYLKLLMNM